MSAAHRRGLEKLFDAFHAKLFCRSLGASLALDQTARHQQKSGTFLHANGGSFRGDVGKQAKRQAGGAKFGDPAVVAEQSGCMSGIGVTKRAELLVIAPDEGRTWMNSVGGFDQAAIDALTEFRHSIRFIDVGPRKELSSKRTKDFLCDIKQGAIVRPAAGNIQQAE